MREGLRRGLAAGAVACLVFALVELPLSLFATRGTLRPLTVLRFLALDLSLAAVAALLVAPVVAGAYLVARSVLPAPKERGPSPAIPWGWALLLAAAGYVGGSVTLTLQFLRRFKEPQLIAGALAVSQLGLILVCALGFWVAGTLLAKASAGLEPRLGRANPLSRWLPAILLLALALILPVRELLRRVPALSTLVPWRELLAVAVVVAAAAVAVRLHERRGRLFPATRRGQLALILPLVVLVPATLWKVGADPDAKYLALTGSPPLTRLMSLVRWANDVDRDGYGSLLGENDCAPFDARVNPSARDLPDNGVDENCNGKDNTARGRASWAAAEQLPVPPAYLKPWNILLVTVDALRYDHTGFGGYKELRGRDTTPHLDAFVARSTSFAFAQAPSAGTMASIPAIVISRFFHSGIALGPERPKKPPLVLPENVTLAEVLKDAGYATAAITTHEYFEDWGLDQGFDSYDNSLGMPPDPYRSPAPQVTEKARAWIEKQRGGGKPWFLWTHYIDPHGRYVAHPGGRSFGATEEDLYDGEIAWTDEHLGRLLEWLAASPEGDHTIVVITSDHGDGFNEHGQINHGMFLYFELLHVPLIIHVPGLAPRVVEGVVSNLDIFPTLAALAKADIRDLELEGESLVPQLFHGKSAAERVVFAETNWPEPLRAAITSRYKLVYNFKANHYELYDLAADPMEKTNLWGKEHAGGDKMKSLLDEWLDRVYYSREPGSQAERVRREKYLLAAPPAPQRPLEARFESTIRVLGTDQGGGGGNLDVTVYFQAVEDGTTVYRAELALLSADGTQVVTRQEKPFAEGVFPTAKWQKGDMVKESFRLKLPAGWKGPGPLRLSLLGPERRPAAASGPNAATATAVELGPL